ncbi:amino acid/amide ABC transporter membrane protein 1, HAAT family [Roseovarius nanhaiticus]|uniref:Amino acid/amide ABC transporter membrane protein 1, HAAT family n=1 Tax=Roseovarius nanhaiticus TaxID=573024 RepID=A0A1N7HNY3_9RHOB|nr:branched-chain amino acid ABC transporter permease [Roseovarius nanhaiticus]SEL40085.1 amino acid/amide ABC transporter membrane protein 1, HAAT family [Roseovarius nanhaiticus]SIS26516.1 amino acid/amide ABC transporter membrane protein 1, HAAT family [Roseovarius nanhaiticus]
MVLAQALISGTAIGFIYALIALSMVLIYKSTDVINFAQGEMAMFSTFICLVLVSRYSLPLGVVLLLAFPIGAAIAAATERVVIRPLVGMPPLNSLIVAIALFYIFHYGAGWIWGYDAFPFPSLLPDRPLNIGGTFIAPNSLAIAGVSILVLAVLYVFLEHSSEGVAMRAASMNRNAAKLMGISVGRVSMLSWAIAGGIGAIAGLLVAPITFIDTQMMFFVLLKALAGAILGGFNSLPGAVIGGILVGIIESLTTVYISAAFDDAIAFVVIVAVLMIKPEGLFGKPAVKKV